MKRRQAVPRSEYRPFPWRFVRDMFLGAVILIGFTFFWLYLLTTGGPVR